MGSKLLIVVDKQRDFEDDRGALTSGAAAQQTTPFVVKLVTDTLAAGDRVLVTLDTHQPGTPEFAVWGQAEFERWGPHCLRYSWGWQLVDAIQQVVDGQRLQGPRVAVMEKPTYDAFLGHIVDGDPGDLGLTLDGFLQRHGIGQIELVGLVTPICVRQTALMARQRGLDVTVYAAGVASFSPESHAEGLRAIAAAGGRIVEA